MRAIASILTLIGFVLSGCSNPRHYWYNPEKLLSEARQDCRECYNEAVDQAAEDVALEYYNRPYDLREARYSSTRSKDEERIALRPLWESTSLGTGHRENIFRGCMKSRGYQLTREDKLDPHIRKSSLRVGKVAGQ